LNDYDFENIIIDEKENDYRSRFIKVNYRSEGVKNVDHKPACLGRFTEGRLAKIGKISLAVLRTEEKR
jgi:hypothetical protein